MKKFCCLILFLLAGLNAAWAQEVYQAHTYVKLVSEQNAVAPGKVFWAGIDLSLDEGWHVYWENPGDSGLSPKVKWQDLPAGITAGDIHWPYPMSINVGPLTSFGYEHEVLLLVPVKVDKKFRPATFDLHAQVNWLACKDICVPGHAELYLPMAMVKDASESGFNHFKSVFDQTRRNWPKAMPSVTGRALLDGSQWLLDIQTPVRHDGQITFYPFRDDIIEHAAPQVVRQTPQGFELKLAKSHIFQGSVNSLDGVAVNPAGWDKQGAVKAIVVRAPVGAAAPAIPFLTACLFALIGGLILNLMPCVLPVLSIKVLHLVERHPDKTIAFRHSLVYAMGILVSVWTLSLLLFVLKTAGQLAGWGFQFQSPVFVMVVALILLGLSLNLFGVFEFSVPAIDGLPSTSGNYEASFISGVITTIVASPCTAPFMGTALTLAISQPNIIGFGIFTALGLGLALPFIILSAFPSLLSIVPKPGLWMIRLKQMLGIVLLACVIWMLWVFGLETGIGDLSRFIRPSQEIQWQKYSPSEIDQARQAGHGVFLDFTAAWCINCQVNDRLVLANPEVVKAFRARGIVAFKADWTKYDPVITQALSSLGRDSIPVYVYYPPGADTPDILPQIISTKIILDKIK